MLNTSINNFSASYLPVWSHPASLCTALYLYCRVHSKQNKTKLFFFSLNSILALVLFSFGSYIFALLKKNYFPFWIFFLPFWIFTYFESHWLLQRNFYSFSSIIINVFFKFIFYALLLLLCTLCVWGCV